MPRSLTLGVSSLRRAAGALLVAAVANAVLLWGLARLNESSAPPVREPVDRLRPTLVAPVQPAAPGAGGAPQAPSPVGQAAGATPRMTVSLDTAVSAAAPARPSPVPVADGTAAPAAPAGDVTGPATVALGEEGQGAGGEHRLDALPRATALPAPHYPREALEARVEGSVRVKLLIDAQGRVTRAEVLEVQGHESFAAAVLQAVRRWRFAPARRGGEDVPVWGVKTVRFALQPLVDRRG